MALPNFICVGAPKCGTTTLYDILRTHPNIYLSAFKEPHFFNVPENYAKGIAYYEQEYFSDVQEEKCVGEFTPSYIFDSAVPRRIKEHLGSDVKILMMLRKPVDRAYSHYLHTLRDGFEKYSFEEALEKEKGRLQTDNYYYKLKYSYASQGRYARHLKAYLEHFDAAQIKVVLFEDFVQDQSKVVNEVLSFLGLEPILMESEVKSNPARSARFAWVNQLMASKGLFKQVVKKMFPSKKLRQTIRTFIMESNSKKMSVKPLEDSKKAQLFDQYFLEDVRELEDLLKIDLKHWR